MAITRPAPAVTIAYAEIDDDLDVTLGIYVDGALKSRSLTAAEAIIFAKELDEVAREALEYAAAEATA
jgi:hypothetical protein